MSNEKRHTLLVVAHPDDETLFFGGLLLSRPHTPWKVICVTDGGADGMAGERKIQFGEALRNLGVKNHEQWDFPDIYEKRLDFEEITKRLKGFSRPRAVYTHGAIGEYGHPHHQDVSRGVHDAFDGVCAVWSPAYNAYPEKVIRLSRKLYLKKLKVLTEIYANETNRFLNLIPSTWSEGWLRAKPSEVRALHDAFRNRTPIPKTLKSYPPLISLYERMRDLPRKF